MQYNAELVLIRDKISNDYILGTIEYKGKIYYTLELPYKNNENYISAIPAGLYSAEKGYSARLGKVIKINNVPNRFAILIHRGNYLKDTTGCILLGQGRSPRVPAVWNSVNAISEIYDKLPDKQFSLRIKEV